MANTAISAAQVKALREATGAGMMECKKALSECEGDFDKAQDWLRVKSGAKADKVAGRQAAEGRVAYAGKGQVGALVEISCETDFVARDENIAGFAQAVAEAVAAAGQMPPHLEQLALANGDTVQRMREAMVMKLGENINIRRIRVLSGDGGEVCAYLHNGDKIAAMCAISGDSALGRDICMHIAAMRPRYLSADSVPADVLAHEREIFISQAVETGKPADMAEKIAAGKLNKWLAECTLLQQKFVKDDEKTVEQILKQAGVHLSGFELLVAGEAE